MDAIRAEGGLVIEAPKHTEVYDVVNVKDPSHDTPQSAALPSSGRETSPHKHPNFFAPPTPTPPARMPHVYTIGTMNVNDITSATRLQMLDQFVKRPEP